MREFDYETAWREVAYPAFKALPASARAALDVVVHEARELHQDSALDMPWTPTIRAAFETLSTDELARASRAVYFAGHWHPGKVESTVPRGGSTWKFARYADQLLSERCGLPRSQACGNGTSYRVIDGALQVCFASNWSLTSTDIDYASPELLASLQSDPTRPAAPNTDRWNRDLWDDWTERATAWAQQRASTGPLFDLERYMVEKAS